MLMLRSFPQARHDRIFDVPLGVPKIHVAGDNDIGGEGMDRITKSLVSRFSHHFGSVNDVIELKSYQIIKVGLNTSVSCAHAPATRILPCGVDESLSSNIVHGKSLRGTACAVNYCSSDI